MPVAARRKKGRSTAPAPARAPTRSPPPRPTTRQAREVRGWAGGLLSGRPGLLQTPTRQDAHAGAPGRKQSHSPQCAPPIWTPLPSPAYSAGIGKRGGKRDPSPSPLFPIPAETGNGSPFPISRPNRPGKSGGLGMTRMMGIGDFWAERSDPGRSPPRPQVSSGQVNVRDVT